MCLIGELSHIKEAIPDIVSLVPLLREAAGYHHYTHHVIFLETICKQIPTLAKNLGKKTFKTVLEDFLDGIFYSLVSSVIIIAWNCKVVNYLVLIASYRVRFEQDCENALTSSAASQCLSHIAAFLGPNILRARVQNYNPGYLKQLESVIYIAPF